MAAHHRGGQNELIFVNNSRLQRGKVVVEEVQEGEHVDLEIIILGPKRKARRARYKLRQTKKNNQSSSKAAKSDSDSDDADNLSDKTDQVKQANEKQKSPSPNVSPKVDESLLKRLESRYGQKRMVADDDTYVDYMDYF